MQLYVVRIYNIIIKNNHYSIISSFDHPIWLIYAINFEACTSSSFSNSSSNDSKGLSPWKRLKEKKVKKEIATRLNKTPRGVCQTTTLSWQSILASLSNKYILEVVVFKENTKNNISKLNLLLHASTNIHYLHTLSYPYHTVAKKVNVLQIRYLDTKCIKLQSFVINFQYMQSRKIS